MEVSHWLEIKMEKQEIINKFIQFFEELLKEKNIETQRKTAVKISDFAGEVNEDIGKIANKTLQEIQEACLPMEHWKDETGYCELDEKDIHRFIRELKSKQ